MRLAYVCLAIVYGLAVVTHISLVWALRPYRANKVVKRIAPIFASRIVEAGVGLVVLWVVIFLGTTSPLPLYVLGACRLLPVSIAGYLTGFFRGWWNNAEEHKEP